jgi:alpha-mannosidase
VDRIGYEAAQKLPDFRPARIGDPFRPLWSTYWFRGRAAVPAGWAGDRVDLLWDSQSEATLWLDGNVAQGLNMTQEDRPDAVLLHACKGVRPSRSRSKWPATRISARRARGSSRPW